MKVILALKDKLIVFCLILFLFPSVHAMQRQERPETRRGRPAILRVMTSVPLRYARNFVVVTYFIGGVEYHYETLVLDMTLPSPIDTALKREISNSLASAHRAHEAFEEWIFREFPPLPPAAPLLRSRRRIGTPPSPMSLSEMEEVKLDAAESDSKTPSPPEYRSNESSPPEEEKDFT